MPAGVLAIVEGRLDDALLYGRGAGTPGRAGKLALPADHFRAGVAGVPLDAAEYPLEFFDRAREYVWREPVSTPDPENPLDGSFLEDVRLDLRLGFYGAAEGAPGRVDDVDGEDVAAALAYPARRAFDEARRVRRAVTYPDIITGAVSDGVVVVDVVRVGASDTLERLPGGRALLTLPLLVRVQYDGDTVYGP